MNPLKLEYNKSTIFLLPIVLDNGIKFTDVITEDFQNTYIADKDNKENDDKLLVKYNSHEQYNTYEWEADEAINLYVFLAGDYFNLTEVAKQKILDFWEQDERSNLYKVLYTIPEGKEDRLIKAPDLHSEILGFEESK